MKKQPKYTRYHRYNSEGVKEIRRYDNGTYPPEVAEEGYTTWSRGTGPHSPEALVNVRNGIINACKGVPKTPEQKHKMSIAKLGVPKSAEHKENLRRSYYERINRAMGE